jgi:mono/diheme cytochrome c family protein
MSVLPGQVLFRKMRSARLVIFLFSLGLGFLISGVEASADEIALGRSLLDQNCARCHAIGSTGNSPFEPAPPFRTLADRYPPEDLEEALAEGIVSGHPAMPEFVFEPDQIAAIIAYLKSLQK